MWTTPVEALAHVFRVHPGAYGDGVVLILKWNPPETCWSQYLSTRVVLSVMARLSEGLSVIARLSEGVVSNSTSLGGCCQ
jgi:hypothetical protein